MIRSNLPCDQRSDAELLDDLNTALDDRTFTTSEVFYDFVVGCATTLMLAAFTWAAAALWVAG